MDRTTNTCEDMQVKFNPSPSWGHRKASYFSGRMDVPPYEVRQFELYVVPSGERMTIKDAGTVSANLTYICNGEIMTKFRRFVSKHLFRFGAKKKSYGRLDLDGLELIRNGDICCGAIVERVGEEACKRGIPYQPHGLRAMISPIAKNYLEIFGKMQEHTQFISKNDQKS